MPTRDAWLDEGLRVLTTEGPGGLRIDRIAVRLGLTKGSFHHHFAGRDGYRTALLAHVEATELAALERVGAETHEQPPLEVLRSLPDRMDELFDADLDRALRAWAVEDDDARDVVQRRDARRLAFLTALWGQLVGEGPRAATAALVPHLVLIGATAVQPPLDGRGLREVMGLLAELVPSVRP